MLIIAPAAPNYVSCTLTVIERACLDNLHDKNARYPSFNIPFREITDRCAHFLLKFKKIKPLLTLDMDIRARWGIASGSFN